MEAGPTPYRGLREPRTACLQTLRPDEPKFLQYNCGVSFLGKVMVQWNLVWRRTTQPLINQHTGELETRQFW